jgi:hypothetical protein
VEDVETVGTTIQEEAIQVGGTPRQTVDVWVQDVVQQAAVMAVGSEDEDNHRQDEAMVTKEVISKSSTIITVEDSLQLNPVGRNHYHGPVQGGWQSGSGAGQSSAPPPPQRHNTTGW